MKQKLLKDLKIGSLVKITLDSPRVYELTRLGIPIYPNFKRYYRLESLDFTIKGNTGDKVRAVAELEENTIIYLYEGVV